MWQEGFHVKKGNQLVKTNEELAKIEGDIGTGEAQVAFAKFCAANPSFTAQLLMGIDLYPFQDIMIRAMSDKDFFLAICSRGLGKSTIASVFIPLYAIFNPGCKIGITSSTFRQSRAIFETIERTINGPNGKFLRQCLNGEPKHKSDAWEMYLGESKIVALPLGCVAADTRVRTEFGWKKIEDVVGETENWSRPSVGSVASNELKPSSVSHGLKLGKKMVKRVRTRMGYELKVTEDHKFWHLGKSGIPDWKTSREINHETSVVLRLGGEWPSQPENFGGFKQGYESGRNQIFKDEIDSALFSCREEYALGFITGLYDFHGKLFLREAGEKQQLVLSVDLPTEEIAREIQLILLDLKLVCSRVENLEGCGMHSLEFTHSHLNNLWKTLGVDVARDKKCIPLLDNVRLLSVTNGKRTRRGSSTIVKSGLNNDEFFSDTVVTRADLREEECYDLRVPVCNNYVANGFITHNSGEKIRGYRFNLLVIDELLLLSERVVNEVLMPFMAVQMDQRHRQNVREAEDLLIENGKLTEEERTIFPNNKLIGLTSASYQFEYLYEMYKSYKKLIFDKDAEKVSHAIMQLSCEMAPPGLYDESNISNARKTFSKSQFDREYMAVFTGDSSGFYSAKQLHAVTLEEGNDPHVLLKGDPDKAYVLAIDPNYDSSETSDDFAMCVLELDDESGIGTMVHGYALPSATLQQRILYLKYLFDNFNIVYFIVDKAGGEKFIKDINDVGGLGFKLAFFEANFETFDEEELLAAKNTYDNGQGVKRIVHSQYFSPNWIRQANETLSADIDHKRTWFASPVDADKVGGKKDIPIKDLLFTDIEKYGNKRADLSLKMNDFVDHQSFMIKKTINQCALIETTSTATGVTRFDLPKNLQSQTGPNKARKDSYSALVLANWAKYCWFKMQNVQTVKRSSFKPRFIAN